jgi:hypothetical protein
VNQRLPPGHRSGGLSVDSPRVTACTLALSPIRDTHSEGFSYFVTSMAAPAAGAVAGWDLHPLESAALSRRTPKAARRCDRKLLIAIVDLEIRSFAHSLAPLPRRCSATHCAGRMRVADPDSCNVRVRLFCERGPSSPRPAIIQTLRRWSILPQTEIWLARHRTTTSRSVCSSWRAILR